MKASKDISRKHFIRQSALTMGALTLAKNMTSKTVLFGSKPDLPTGNINLKNVRLETGFEYDGNEIIATKTALFYVRVQNGIITQIGANQPEADFADANGLLMLPSFSDMHIHLDKTLYGGKWQALRKSTGGVKGMIALEQKVNRDLLTNSIYKAEKLIELLQSKGTGFARSQVNIEPTSKLDSLIHLQKALENKTDSFSAELVAFPQHGIFYTDSIPYMREAAKMNIDFIGGLDPYTIDGAIEKTMDFTVQLALDNDKGIDIHLHETGESGLKTVEYLIAKVNENPVLKGKTFLSHCFILGKLEEPKLSEISEKLADAQIGINSTVPFGRLIMPIPTLLRHKVKVMTGNDSIVDYWSTFGTGSVLQKANLAAQLYGYRTEFELSRLLKLASPDIIPLDDNGKRQWPNIGDKADFALLNASCSAEAVSRISPVQSLIHNGNVVF